MRITKLEEAGYEWSALGFSLSYNTSTERAKELLPKYAFKNTGENKFLRVIETWWDITAPRFWHTENDTYKISTVRLSESTMHTIMKKELVQEDFEYSISTEFLSILNNYVNLYKASVVPADKKQLFLAVKNHLPEGYLQRIVFHCNYATLQYIYSTRKDHRLPQWHYWCDQILNQIEHPEFIVRSDVRET